MKNRDWNIYDESMPSSIKNKPVDYIAAGTVWYEKEVAIERHEDGSLFSRFNSFFINPNLEYNIQWGPLYFPNQKLNMNSIIDLDMNCNIEFYKGGDCYINAPTNRFSPSETNYLKFTVAKDYIKKLDEKYLPDRIRLNLFAAAMYDDIALIFEEGLANE